MDARERDLGISRRGRVPTWLAISLGAGALFIGVEFISERLYAQGYSLVDTRRARIVSYDSEPCAPSEWSGLVAVHLAELGPLAADDPREVAEVAAILRSLPIFRSVSEPRVIWPDGIEVEVRLRRAAACIQFDGGFRSVSRDGGVLPGFSVSQPDGALGPLPLIAWGEALQGLAMGDLLPEDQHFDALSVAVSMQDHLTNEQRSLLGPIVIRSEAAAPAGAEAPRVRLALPGSRGVVFGRAPIAGRPGELPEEIKWGHIVEYLESYPRGGRDWAVLDVRWDVPVVSWKE